MSTPQPDWTARFPPPRPLTERQQHLLQELEAALPSSRAAVDHAQIAAAVSPIVRALRDSGLTAEQIADNSRLRPAFVRDVLDGAA